MKKLILLKMIGEIGIKKACLTQNVIWGLLCYLFSMKMLDGVNIKKLLNSISYAGLAQKSSFVENDSPGMYVEISFNLIC